MKQHPSKMAVIILIWLFCSIPLSASEDAPFLWLFPDMSTRLTDGRIEQTVTLEVFPKPAEGKPDFLQKPQAWLRIRGVNGGLWQQAEWSSFDPWTLTIRSGVFAVADIFVRAEIDGQPHFAQSYIILYGQALGAENDMDGFREGPNWPEFKISSNAEFYWPQTGHTFFLDFYGEKTKSSCYAAGSYLEVRGRQGELLDLIRSSGNGFAHTPAHDPTLNRLGPAAAKPVIFVIRLEGGGAASFTQMVHRSRFGALNKRAGLIVFSLSLAFSALAVCLVRRRKRQCW